MPPKRKNPKPATSPKTSPSSNSKATQAQGLPRSKSSPRALSQLPPGLQQLVLDIFATALRGRFNDSLPAILQEIKGHLYARDFDKAFGRDDYLEAYCARWSPSRALGILQVMHSTLRRILDPIDRPEDDPPEPVVSNLTLSGEDSKLEVVCLGGGAGTELAVLAALCGVLGSENGGDSESCSNITLKLELVDIANWSSVLQSLYDCITLAKPEEPKLTNSVGHAVQCHPQIISPDAFQYAFHQHDVLKMSSKDLRSLVKDARLVTLCFTLNELYSTSLSMTNAFLLQLADTMQPDAYLLVIDSAGSYSTVQLNGREKKYPMQWLLDHVLDRPLGDKGFEPPGGSWKKVDCEDSVWFRYSSTLRYPLQLENMRYQYHLFKRVA